MKSKPLLQIGTIESLSLPDEGIQDVLAKVDTGAYSSAIWASAIREQDGELSFVLFGETSPYYTGKVLTATNYKVTAVKNSFGQSELRYKVPIKIKLAGRTIRAQFTLANRTNNRYPILVGRRTLRSKFLVDVSRKYYRGKYHVLLLSVKPNATTAEFSKSLETHNKKLSIKTASYDKLRFIIVTSGNRIELADSGEDIANFDLVHFKTTTRRMDIAASAARYLHKRDVRFFDSAAMHFPASSKLYQYIILGDHNIAVPESVFILPKPLSQSYDYIKERLGLPFILKDIYGNKGKNNFLITDEKAFNKVCQQAERVELRLLAQTFVQNDGDYRVLVLGGRIALVIRRQRAHDATHLNNTSQGGTATLVNANTLPAQVRKDSIAAAKLMGREVAGVDMVHDKIADTWYCLEVNDGPQIATGSFIDEKSTVFAEFLQRELTK